MLDLETVKKMIDDIQTNEWITYREAMLLLALRDYLWPEEEEGEEDEN